MTAEHLLGAYLDTNILLIAVAVIWSGFKLALNHTPLRAGYQLQLNLLYVLVAMVAISPVVFMGIDAVRAWGAAPGETGLSLSDFLVAQYLNGSISMAPTQFERLLNWRGDLTRDMVTLSSTAGVTLVALLATGISLTLAWKMREAWRLVRMIRGSFVLRRMGRIDIRFTHETRVPFSTRGLFRYYIVLPTRLLTHQNDVRIAVSHELQHVRQNDLSWEVALEMLRPVFFWNPAFAYCKRDIERLRELACDSQVLRKKTHAIRDYCECLLRVSRAGLPVRGNGQIITPSVPFVQVDRRLNASQSSRFLRQRIVSLLDQAPETDHVRVGTALMMLSVVITLMATVALRPTQDWSHDRLMLSTIVNLERLNSRTITR